MRECNPLDLLDRHREQERLMRDLDRLERLTQEVDALQQEVTAMENARVFHSVSTINGVAVMQILLKGVSPRHLKDIADEGKRQIGSGIVVVLTT